MLNSNRETWIIEKRIKWIKWKKLSSRQKNREINSPSHLPVFSHCPTLDLTKKRGWGMQAVLCWKYHPWRCLRPSLTASAIAQVSRHMLIVLLIYSPNILPVVQDTWTNIHMQSYSHDFLGLRKIKCFAKDNRVSMYKIIPSCIFFKWTDWQSPGSVTFRSSQKKKPTKP